MKTEASRRIKYRVGGMTLRIIYAVYSVHHSKKERESKKKSLPENEMRAEKKRKKVHTKFGKLDESLSTCAMCARRTKLINDPILQ